MSLNGQEPQRGALPWIVLAALCATLLGLSSCVAEVGGDEVSPDRSEKQVEATQSELRRRRRPPPAAGSGGGDCIPFGQTCYTGVCCQPLACIQDAYTRWCRYY